MNNLADLANLRVDSSILAVIGCAHANCIEQDVRLFFTGRNDQELACYFCSIIPAGYIPCRQVKN